MNTPNRIIADTQPSIIQSLNNGNYYYNYNIIFEDDGTYSYVPIYINTYPTYEICTKRTIRVYIDQDEEFNLINSANSSTNSIINNQETIQAYNEYLNLLQVIKYNVKQDFNLITLEQKRQIKYNEIIKNDKDSNEFFIFVRQGSNETTNKSFWLNKDTRNSLLNTTFPALKAKGETSTLLWSDKIPHNSIEVPLDWAITNVLEVEYYAKSTYDLRCKNENLIYNAKTEEELNNIDISTYPNKITLILNID